MGDTELLQEKFDNNKNNEGIFVYTESAKVHTSVVRVRINASVISDRAFEHCSKLVSVTFAPTSSLVTVGGAAFACCTGLSYIDFSGCPGLIEIGTEAFSGCTGLTNINMPPNLSVVRKMAFMECTALHDIKIPPSVTSIEYGAFAMCTGLTQVKLPPFLTQISAYSFAHCNSLKSVEASLDHPSSSSVFTTIAIRNRNSIAEALKKSNFHPFHLENVLNGEFDIDPDATYFDWKVYARIRNERNGRLPLLSAVDRGLKWSSLSPFSSLGWLRLIFEAYMPAIEESDSRVTGLQAFMLAAAREDSNLETVYSLLRLNPIAVMVR